MLPKMLVQCFRDMRKVRTSFAMFGAGPRHSQIYCSKIETVDSECNQTWKPQVTAHVESCRRRPWYVWRPNQAGIPALEAEVLTWDHSRSWWSIQKNGPISEGSHPDPGSHHVEVHGNPGQGVAQKSVKVVGMSACMDTSFGFLRKCAWLHPRLWCGLALAISCGSETWLSKRGNIDQQIAKVIKSHCSNHLHPKCLTVVLNQLESPRALIIIGLDTHGVQPSRHMLKDSVLCDTCIHNQRSRHILQTCMIQECCQRCLDR